MDIEFKKISVNEKEIFKNILEFYSYDFCQYYNYDLNENGKFEKINVEKYFENNIYQVLFIVINKKIAGFIIKKEDETFKYVDEFWIMPKYRKGLLTYRVIKEFRKLMDGIWIFSILNNNDRWLKSLEVMLKKNEDKCKIIAKRTTTCTFEWGEYEFTEFLVDCKNKIDS